MKDKKICHKTGNSSDLYEQNKGNNLDEDTAGSQYSDGTVPRSKRRRKNASPALKTCPDCGLVLRTQYGLHYHMGKLHVDPLNNLTFGYLANTRPYHLLNYFLLTPCALCPPH